MVGISQLSKDVDGGYNDFKSIIKDLTETQSS